MDDHAPKVNDVQRAILADGATRIVWGGYASGKSEWQRKAAAVLQEAYPDAEVAKTETDGIRTTSFRFPSGYTIAFLERAERAIIREAQEKRG